MATLAAKLSAPLVYLACTVEMYQSLTRIKIKLTKNNVKDYLLSLPQGHINGIKGKQKLSKAVS